MSACRLSPDSVSGVSGGEVCLHDDAYLNPPGVWLEASGRVLGRHSALDRAAVHPDIFLLEAQFWQAAALTHMQLGMHQVHAVREGERERR